MHLNLAERRGFEPRHQLPSYYLSKVAQSTTLPSLRFMDKAFYIMCMGLNKKYLNYLSLRVITAGVYIVFLIDKIPLKKIKTTPNKKLRDKIKRLGE